MIAPPRHFFLIVLLLGCCLSALAQEATAIRPDSLTTLVIPSDTAAVPSVIKSQSSDLDTLIRYSALTVDHQVEDRKTLLIGKAQVQFKNMTLRAGQISMDWSQSLIVAEGSVDTVWVKAQNPGDSTATVTWRDQPVFVDQGDEMHGFKMIYNYKTEKASVIKGRTTMENAFYTGDHVKMITRDVFNVARGRYTACDADSPHYFFFSRRMKMMVNDKVIARPIVFFLHNIPVAALPFAVFPLKRGRHSGIIMPRYGESYSEGRYLRELGYYWAPNDYYDVKSTVDFFEKTGWLFRSELNYAMRYWLNGSINGSMTRKNFSGGVKSRRWDLNVRHDQTIDQNTRFSANGYFVSDKNFYRDLSPNLDTRLNRELRSNATFSKYWPDSKNSLTVNVSQTRDLQTDNLTTILPQASFRMGQRQPFKPQETRSRRQQSTRRREQPPWYQSIYFSYNSRLINSERRYTTTAADFSKFEKKELTRELEHSASVSMSSPKKFFGWLDLSQYINFNENWYDKTREYYLNRTTNTIESRDKNGFATRHTFQYSASANTKIYGMITPGIGKLLALRHVVTPRLSFSYQPDFSERFWGYYQYLADTTGRIQKNDRFRSTPGYGQKSVNFSVSNLFQAKIKSGEQEKKLDLFSFDLNSGYNFEVEQYRLSPLTSAVRANPASNFSLTLSTTHDFYQYDETLNRRVNRYLFQDGGWKHGDFFRLTNFRFNSSLRLASKSGSNTGRPGQSQPQSSRLEAMEDVQYELPDEELSVLEEEGRRTGDRFGVDERLRGFNVSWRTSLSFEYVLNRSNPNRTVRNYNLSISGLELSLTRNWRISYNAHFDLKERTVSYHTFTFYRDLHCWEATLVWVPSGIAKRYYFRINIKAPQLQDLKLERRGGTARSSAFGYY